MRMRRDCLPSRKRGVCLGKVMADIGRQGNGMLGVANSGRRG